MLPIYRAKKIDSDEYIVGYLLPLFMNEKYFISTDWTIDFDGYTPNFIEIDPTTLAIHFPDMLDSQGNKIFASLSEDGKGGDMAKYTNKQGTYIGTYMFSQRFTFGIHLELKNKTYINVDFEDKNDLENFKIISIQE